MSEDLESVRINVRPSDVRMGRYSSGVQYLELSSQAVERIAYAVTPLLSQALADQMVASLPDGFIDSVAEQVIVGLTAAMEQAKAKQTEAASDPAS